jgi:hypothetical protein
MLLFASPNPSSVPTPAPPVAPNVPPLPVLHPDVLLEVMTHPSVRGPRIDDNPSSSNSTNIGDGSSIGDANRFAVVGAVVLDMFVTEILFAYRPALEQEQIKVRCSSVELCAADVLMPEV